MPRTARMLSMSLAAAACFTSALADGIKAPALLEVIDSRGAIVGTVVQEQSPAHLGAVLMSIEINGTVAMVNADASGVESGNAGSRILFLTTDCSGTPYIEILGTFSPTPLYPFSVVSAPGQTLYVTVPDAPIQYLQPLSFRSLGDSLCQPSNLGPFHLAPATALADLSASIHPPMHVSAIVPPPLRHFDQGRE